MAFLRKGFKVKESSGYMKFVAGENRIRILSDAIDGHVYWLTPDGEIIPRGDRGPEGSKPVRVRTLEEAGKKNKGAQYDCKQFLAFVVWNYASEEMEILDITQKGIMRSLEGLSISEDWGDPTAYDIVIEKEGEKLKTEYTVRPIPPKPFEEDVKGLADIKLESLYEGGDPFAKKDESLSDEELRNIIVDKE